MAALPDEDFEALTSYFDKARGWMLVGAGGFLIAVRETWDLIDGYGWPTWLFVVLLVTMAPLSAASAALQARERQRMADRRRAAQEQRAR